jgi:hypothetical protein
MGVRMADSLKRTNRNRGCLQVKSPNQRILVHRALRGYVSSRIHNAFLLDAIPCLEDTKIPKRTLIDGFLDPVGHLIGLVQGPAGK